MSAERAHPKPLTDQEVDDIVTAEADDAEAWEEPIHVVPHRDRATVVPAPTSSDPKQQKKR
jgi:hypothetical protein